MGEAGVGSCEIRKLFLDFQCNVAFTVDTSLLVSLATAVSLVGFGVTS